MQCNMTLEKNLKGYTQITITTPQGTKLLVNLVCKDKQVLKKLLYKITREYIEYAESTKSNKTK